MGMLLHLELKKVNLHLVWMLIYMYLFQMQIEN